MGFGSNRRGKLKLGCFLQVYESVQEMSLVDLTSECSFLKDQIHSTLGLVFGFRPFILE